MTWASKLIEKMFQGISEEQFERVYSDMSKDLTVEVMWEDVFSYDDLVLAVLEKNKENKKQAEKEANRFDMTKHWTREYERVLKMLNDRAFRELVEAVEKVGK